MQLKTRLSISGKVEIVLADKDVKNPKFKQGPKKGVSPHFGVLLYFEEQFLDYRSKADGIVILKT